MRIEVLTVIIIFSSLSFSCKSKKQNSENDVTISRVVMPTFPNCKNDNDKTNCSKNYVSDLVLKEVINQELFIDNDTLKIEFSVDINGLVVPRPNFIKSSNKKLEEICYKVLKKLPYVKPAYNADNNVYQYSIQSFYVIIISNLVTNKK